MFAKPINGALKKHLKQVFDEAVKKAEADFKKNIETKLLLLPLFDQIKLLIDEDERVDAIIENHSHPFYIHNHSSENWLLTQFASRTYLLNVDETKELSEAICLGKYHSLIFKKKHDLREQIPLYTYNDFLAGKICPYFERFRSTYNVPQKDYYEIRNWQAEHLLKIVDYEYRVLIKKIQSHCKTLSQPLDFIRDETQKIEGALDNALEDASLIKGILSTLFIFKGEKLSMFNDQALVENFKIYKSSQLDWREINPFTLKPILKKIVRKESRIISSEKTIFYTINKLADWFEKVLEGQPLQQPVVIINWEQVLSDINKDAQDQIDKLTEEIYDFTENTANSKDEIKEFLIAKLESYRRKFNAFDMKHVFALLDVDRKIAFKRNFITNSFFGNDIETMTEAYKSAVIIQEMSYTVIGAYMNTFDTHVVDFPEKDGNHIEIMYLLHQMVLDKELYNSLRNALDDFMSHFEIYRLPFELHRETQREVMSNLFHKAIDRLQSILDVAEPTNKVLFLQSRIKELRHRELRMKQYNVEELAFKKANKYSTLFREFLEIEADFICETRHLVAFPSLPALQEAQKNIQVNGSESSSFDQLFSGEKGLFVLDMLEDLSITQNGIALLSERRKGAIRGVVEALKSKKIAPALSINTLCDCIAAKIGIELKSKLDFSTTSQEYQKSAEKYIRENYNQ